MKIVSKKRVIEMTKAEAKSAEKYGSEVYRALQAARKDYPNFKVVTVSRKAPGQKESYKGLTCSYMESYIKAHDDEKKSMILSIWPVESSLIGVKLGTPRSEFAPWMSWKSAIFLLKTCPKLIHPEVS